MFLYKFLPRCEINLDFKEIVNGTTVIDERIAIPRFAYKESPTMIEIISDKNFEINMRIIALSLASKAFPKAFYPNFEQISLYKHRVEYLLSETLSKETKKAVKILKFH